MSNSDRVREAMKMPLEELASKFIEATDRADRNMSALKAAYAKSGSVVPEGNDCSHFYVTNSHKKGRFCISCGVDEPEYPFILCGNYRKDVESLIRTIKMLSEPTRDAEAVPEEPTEKMLMDLTPDQAYKLAKLCKKYYKAYNKYWEHLHDPSLDECDELWENDAFDLDEKKYKAKEKLDKYLKKLEDKS